MSKEKVLSLTKYAEGLKRRLEGDIDPNLKFVLKIDLKKTLAKIEYLKLNGK